MAALAEEFFKNLSTNKRDQLLSGLSTIGVIPQPNANVSRKRKRSGQSLTNTSTSASSFTPCESSFEAQTDDEVIVLSSDSEHGEEVGEGEDNSHSAGSPTSVNGDVIEYASNSDQDGNVSDSSDSENDLRNDSSLPQESESDDESDYWADVITLDDDDDDDGAEENDKGPREMICFRCPNLRLGKFKDKEKFRIHTKRHIFGDHFCCNTCGRPFTKLNYCLSHEIRVHDTQIEYDKRDPVISYAKRYAEAKKAKRAQRAAEQNGHSSSATPIYETDEETDCEDPKFYNDLVVSSTTLYKYRGPPVNNNLETYEIQINHARPRFSRSNQIAKLALQAHQRNIENNHDTYRLGRFSKSKKKVTVPVPVAKPRGNPKQSRPPPKASSKRQLSDGSDIECTNNPKKKRRVRYKYITSSSSSSSSEDKSDSDKDYQPSNKKRRVRGVESESTTSDSDDQLSQPSSKQKKGKRQIREITRQLVPALIVRICQQCNYVWQTEVDLRTHRDAMHPNFPISALMPVVEVKEKRRCKVKPKRPEHKLVKPLEIAAATPKRQRSPGTEKKGNAKQKQIPTTPKRHYPIPDSSFSEKEKFLYRFGLINVVRLNVFRNKGMNVDLPDCFVELEKLEI